MSERIAMKRLVMSNGGSVESFLETEDYTNELMKQILAGAPYNGQAFDKYTLLDDAYRGAGGFADGSYLIPHTRERNDKYVRRRNMAYYVNYVKPIVDAHINPIFRNEPSRDRMSPTFELFTHDVDGNGTPLTRFMKKAAIASKLHGVEFIVVDMERIGDDEVVTRRDMLDNRLFPYLYLVSPAQINNWATDKFGRLVYISYNVTSSVTDDSGSYKNITETYIWTKDVCKRVVGDKEETFVNHIGMIPIVPLYGTINNTDDLIVQSDMYSVAQASVALYNAMSEMRERSRSQAFSVLTYPLDVDDDYESGAEGLTVGTADVLMYKNGSQKPEWITPPEDSTNIIETEINLIIKQIYRERKMSYLNTNTISNVSGVSRHWDMLNMFATMLELSQGCQEAEVRIAKIFSSYVGEDNSEFSVSYNKEFGIVDPAEVLANATSVLAMNVCGDLNVEVKRQVIRAILADVDSAVVTHVLKALDNEPTKEEPISKEDVSVIQPTAK